MLLIAVVFLDWTGKLRNEQILEHDRGKGGSFHAGNSRVTNEQFPMLGSMKISRDFLFLFVVRPECNINKYKAML